MIRQESEGVVCWPPVCVSLASINIGMVEAIWFLRERILLRLVKGCCQIRLNHKCHQFNWLALIIICLKSMNLMLTRFRSIFIQTRMNELCVPQILGTGTGPTTHSTVHSPWLMQIQQVTEYFKQFIVTSYKDEWFVLKLKLLAKFDIEESKTHSLRWGEVLSVIYSESEGKFVPCRKYCVFRLVVQDSIHFFPIIHGCKVPDLKLRDDRAMQTPNIYTYLHYILLCTYSFFKPLPQVQ